MEIYESLIDFFGIVPLEADATFIDLINQYSEIAVAVFLVCFFIRSLFLIVALPSHDSWS